jgi:putative tryptophan/tyrosine transport system substrate-binding protein
VEQFRQGLREAGYTEGRDIAIEVRSAHGNYGRVQSMMAEVVRTRPDVIVVENTLTVHAAKYATKTIPIVIAVAADPVGSGLVDSLAQPGGNITGLSMMIAELAAKRFQLLRDAMPTLKVLGILRDPSVPWHAGTIDSLNTIASSNGVSLAVVSAKTPSELKSAFETLKQRLAKALFVLDSPLFDRQRDTILSLAVQSHIPVIFGRRDWAERGALFSYSADFGDMFRRAAVYVDKILRGVDPRGLPIEQPTKFDLVINLKTATRLGLTIPDSLLVQANELIK